MEEEVAQVHLPLLLEQRGLAVDQAAQAQPLLRDPAVEWVPPLEEVGVQTAALMADARVPADQARVQRRDLAVVARPVGQVQLLQGRLVPAVLPDAG